MAFSVKLLDNLSKVLNGFDTAIEKGLEEVGLAAEGYAKAACPVDTGRLRNSISYVTVEKQEGMNDSSGDAQAEPGDYAPHGSPDKRSVVVGTNVNYAKYVEFGAGKRKAKHFIKRATTGHRDEYKGIIERNLKGQ